MVFCTYCGQSFTRDEHLERHILTHTNVKPFKCFICHMSFARRDLLQRHYTVHGRDQNLEIISVSNGIIPKSAGRTPIACGNCAKTKTKCDKKFPCSRCSARGLCCTLRPTRRSTKNASRIGLITAETIANGQIEIPADSTVAARHIDPLTLPIPPLPALISMPLSSPYPRSSSSPEHGTPRSSISSVSTPPFDDRHAFKSSACFQPRAAMVLSPPSSHDAPPHHGFDSCSSSVFHHMLPPSDDNFGYAQSPDVIFDWSQVPPPPVGVYQVPRHDSLLSIPPGMCLDYTSHDPAFIAMPGQNSQAGGQLMTVPHDHV